MLAKTARKLAQDSKRFHACKPTAKNVLRAIYTTIRSVVGNQDGAYTFELSSNDLFLVMLNGFHWRTDAIADDVWNAVGQMLGRDGYQVTWSDDSQYPTVSWEDQDQGASQ